ERFLNPGRKSMPDMDIDFAVAGRDRVINYVAEKYGRDRVAQIITFGTMMARAAVRDAGRVLETPYGTVDRIAKLIPEGPRVYLQDCLKPGAELRHAYEADPLVREIVDLAKPLEGLIRQDSIHAAGVVIGDRPLVEYVPLQQKGADQEIVTQFPMGDVEALGLVKPTAFEDLIALVALYRPGPMAYIPVYARRKHSQEQVTYPDPRLAGITGSAYGICLFQEQFMEIAKQLAGFSPAEADDLRK